MRFFFKRTGARATPPAENLSGGTTTAELPAPVEEPRPEETARIEELLRAEDNSRMEEILSKPSMPGIASFAPAKQLVHANDLPSAADVLADLFADAPADSAPNIAPDVAPDIEMSAAIEVPVEAAVKPPVEAPKIVVQPPARIVAIDPVVPQVPVKVELAKADASAKSAVEHSGEGDASSPVTQHAEVLPESSTGPAPGELCPEDAATVLAAASEEIKSEELPANADGSSMNLETGAALESLSELPSSSANWAFEEILASHREWVESKGLHGKKADLANAQLDGVELINVNLRLADLHYADLKSADLLLADLRDACMVRADLEEACLVGANLEGANLEGATFETALGLVPRQLAGANLREASLPSQIAQFPAAAIFHAATRGALRFFSAIVALCVFSALAIWKTKDIQLVTDSAILPFLHSAKAAAAMPSAELFLITPVVLFLLYLAFLAQIQRAWGAALELPAVFPDGKSLGENEPWMIVGLLRAHFRWMNHDAPSAGTLQTTLSLLLAYWTVPLMLLLFWARYLTLQEIHGTMLHELLASVAAGVALHATFKVGRPQEKWALQRTFASRIAEKLRHSKPPVLVGILLAIATFFSFGTIAGVPHDRSRAPQYGAANIRRWAPTALWSVGYDPYADLTEAMISTPPAGWNWSDDTVASVRGVRLSTPRFRYAQAYGAFFANAHLWHADFRGAYLSNSDFRAADLTQSNFQLAVMDSARMNHANLDRSILQGGHFARTDFRDANLSYAAISNSFLMDARFDGASLYDALLSNSTLIRAVFDRADLRNAHIDSSNLEHADLHQAYLWSASVQNSDLKGADLGSAILIGASLRGSNLSGAHFDQTVLNETDLTGAILDAADMHGAFGLTAYQVCSARSHAGALFDDALQPQIQAQCPSH
jgi:uncharacterized protein YjbI with pentapeptide repeats